jgi:hypothetical protein
MKEHTGGPFIYSALGGITCAICAPAYMPAEEIEAFAYLRLGATNDGNRWRVFDKSKLDFLQPSLATPNPCNTTPDRLHWFLIDSEMAKKWATAEALSQRPDPHSLAMPPPAKLLRYLRREESESVDASSKRASPDS